MTHTDIEFAFECTDSEGWVGETRETFSAFLEYDPDGCFVAEENGRNVGMCVATKYNNNGFIGELVVIREMRGCGFGRRLFERSMSYLKEQNIENVFLDADLEAVPIYEKSGFKKICKSLRFVGRVAGERSELVQATEPGDIGAICKIDCELFGDDRSFFLRRRYSLFPALFQVLKIDGEIRGYISAHPGNGLISVGPWASIDKEATPIALLKSLSIETGDSPLRIGVLENNSLAVGMIASIDSFEETGYCWRMVSGSSDKLGMSDNLYSIGSGAKG